MIGAWRSVWEMRLGSQGIVSVRSWEPCGQGSRGRRSPRTGWQPWEVTEDLEQRDSWGHSNKQFHDCAQRSKVPKVSTMSGTAGSE